MRGLIGLVLLAALFAVITPARADGISHYDFAIQSANQISAGFTSDVTRFSSSRFNSNWSFWRWRGANDNDADDSSNYGSTTTPTSSQTSGNPVSTPEPGMLLLLGTALLGFVSLRKFETR